MTTTTSKQAEVAFGLANEERIAYEWLSRQKIEPLLSLTLTKAGGYADFDYWVFDPQGILVCYLEVKMRRKPLSAFGDAMFPLRKHKLGLRVKGLNNAPFLAVTEYACGSLVQVDLSLEPSFERDIARRDRPGMKPVPHVFYTKDKMTILQGAR